jgi:hypothetical protein
LQLLHAIFRNNANFAALESKAKALTSTQKIWNEIVPEPLKSASQAGSIEHNRLTVYVEHGAVAAKIKLLLPSLLSKLQKQGVKITSIRVQVQVQSQQEKSDKPNRSLSTSAANEVGSLAGKLKGTALGDALKRLSERVK